LFERDKGVYQSSFRALEHINPLNKQSLSKIRSKSIENLPIIDLKEINKTDEELSKSPWSSVEFYVYKLNLVDILAVNKIKSRQLLETLVFNLNLIKNITEEDIVGFDRSFYFHHAVVTGKFN
jgi:hypothetical protein